MTITASQVSELRKLTDCGMMDCKKALTESDGNMDKAVEILRKKGMAKAAKRAGKVAAEGVIKIQTTDDVRQAIILEMNCETDFVAKDDNFQAVSEEISRAALEKNIGDLNALLACQLPSGQTVEAAIQALAVKIGENIHIRRVAAIKSSQSLGVYLHGNRIGVLVSLTGGDETLAKDLAMHIAASKPSVISPEQVSEDLIEKEREIYRAQAAESDKPPEIVEKMIGGRIKKFLNEVSLIGQPFVKDPDKTVLDLLKSKNATVENFIRFELGEGIEKETVDFAKEVMEQVGQ